jgi:hypothetical protein
VSKAGGGGQEQLVHPPAGVAPAGHRELTERLPDRLCPLDEEPPGPIAAGAAEQLAGCHHARRAFGSGRCVGRAGTAGRVEAQAAVPSFADPSFAGTLALATSTRAAKAVGSLIAISERTLRSTSTPAIFRPWMKRL